MTASGIATQILLAVFFTSTSPAADSSLTSLQTGLTNLVYDVSRSVVTIEASRTVVEPGPGGGVNESLQQLISSGLVVDSSGYILVAASSVAKYDRLLVSFESILVPASLIAIDYQTGLALLKAPRPLGAPVNLSRQHGCAGQMVVAVGNSLGLRACPALGFCAGFRPDGAMQFSTAITPGAIGGGVFDLSGRLLGAITDGIGAGRVAEAALAVPAHKLPNIITFLRTRGDREAGYVGITTTDIEVFPGIEVIVPTRFAKSGGTPTQVVERGTVITDIVPGSPAARAGLLINDLLYSMDGRPISSAWKLMEVVLRMQPGGEIELGLLRQNKPRQISVTIGRRDLATGGGFSQSPNETFRAIPSQDSLHRELEALKKTVERLERQLRR